MMCFRDMAFCSSDCVKVDCRRNFSEARQDEARAWWGKEGAPVAFADFHLDCPNYVSRAAIMEELVALGQEMEAKP